MNEMTAHQKRVAHLLGCNIRESRQLANLSQDGLALRANLDRSYMGRVERGVVNVTLEKVYRLAETLDVPVGHLLPMNTEVY